MHPPISSFSEVLSARSNLIKEKNFLSKISIQCDDETLVDSFLDKKGEPILIKAIVVARNNPDSIRFILDKKEIGVISILKSLKEIKRYQNLIGA